MRTTTEDPVRIDPDWVFCRCMTSGPGYRPDRSHSDQCSGGRMHCPRPFILRRLVQVAGRQAFRYWWTLTLAVGDWLCVPSPLLAGGTADRSTTVQSGDAFRS